MRSRYKEIEAREGKPMAQILHEMYEKHNSQEKVAEVLGVTQGTLSLWLMRAGLKQKTILVPREPSKN